MNKPRQKHQRGPTHTPVLAFGGWGESSATWGDTSGTTALSSG